MKKKVVFEQIHQARKVLKLEEFTTLEEIKGAYRRLAAEYHPDRCRGARLKTAKKRFEELTGVSFAPNHLRHRNNPR